MSARLTAYIAILVSIVWTMSFIADIAIPAYDPSPFVHMAMMAVVGAAFSHTVLKKRNGL
ncbi:MAG: hypothetical protein ACRDIC_06090 [bacterium]